MPVVAEKNDQKNVVGDVRTRLIDVMGRTTQDIGMGRVTGQVFAIIYLSPAPCSLDDICLQLKLSKASISIAARQLENLGVIQRHWQGGDRKVYYETARHFGVALRDGLIRMLRQKVQLAGAEIDAAMQIISQLQDRENDPELKFMSKRLQRAIKLRDKMNWLFNNPIIRMLGNE